MWRSSISGERSPPRRISRVTVNQIEQGTERQQLGNSALVNFNDAFDDHSDEQQHDNLDQHQLAHHNEETDSLHEVYLFSCCGKTRELKPVHNYRNTFAKLFHLFNALAFLFGLANFGMGLWFRIDPKVYEIHEHIETQNFTIAGWIMLFGGFLACLTAIVGFLAATTNSISLLLWHITIMIALMLSFVSTVIMLTVYGLGTSLELFLIKEIYEQIRRRAVSTETQMLMSNEAVQFMDFVQVKMRCCGAADFRDYQKLGMVIPTTCYTIAGNYINAPGCGRAIRRLLDIRAGMGAGFSTGSVISHLFVSLFCGLMICSIYTLRTSSPNRQQGAPLASTS